MSDEIKHTHLGSIVGYLCDGTLQGANVRASIATPQPIEVATLRDQFAMAATDEDIKLYVYDLAHGDRAKARYLFADAMLAARREGQGDG